ncbi:MAG: methylmalonyl-CoA epimerase [Halobacteriovoraceae bacterium]|nr:methylmalonyl-CoA epimerase [Halobacteriovoraceae bacterium]|tara:strand:+ start:120840 stop:121262 length:423 start_codon:yes stop_codon:yes gene_type:complete
MLPELENCVLDHVAIAVKDLEESVKVYEAIGLKFSGEREVVEAQKVKTAFAPIDENGHIELLQSTDESGPIGKYIQKKGPGIHHMCFRVPDIVKKEEELRSKGFRLLYEKAQVGAGNCLVNFIHPKSTGGALIEISEKQS